MESDGESQALVPAESRPLTSVAGRHGMLVPRVIVAAGDQAARRFLEFFAATIRNKNTRAAYYHATVRFFAWCDRHKIGEIADIEPLHVAAYIEALNKDFEKPTVKQHLAAIRMLFDWLVTGQVVATNPAHAVRGPKHVVKTGKTPVLTGEQARELLDSIDTSTPGRLARPGADFRHDIRLCPHWRGRRHARRGLLSQGQALVGSPARKRRQAA